MDDLLMEMVERLKRYFKNPVEKARALLEDEEVNKMVDDLSKLTGEDRRTLLIRYLEKALKTIGVETEEMQAPSMRTVSPDVMDLFELLRQTMLVLMALEIRKQKSEDHGPKG